MAVDWDKPIQTKDGRLARFLGLRNHPTHPRVVAVPTYRDGVSFECVDTYTEGGRLYEQNPMHNSNIINVPQKHVRWQNVYEYPFGPRASGFFATREAANAADEEAHLSRIACIRIEFEEGEGL